MAAGLRRKNIPPIRAITSTAATAQFKPPFFSADSSGGTAEETVGAEAFIFCCSASLAAGD